MAAGGAPERERTPGRRRRTGGPTQGLRRVGLEISTQVVQSTGSFVILRKHAPLEDEFPRRRNLPLKSPLWS